MDRITAMYLHHRKRKVAEYEVLLSPWMDKKKTAQGKLNKKYQDVSFLSPEEYALMSKEELAAKQKAMDMHWANFKPY